MNFSFLFGFILDFGLTGYNNRTVAQQEHLAAENTSSILGMKTILSLVYALISIGTAFIIGYDSIHFKLFMWVGINQILASFILFLRSNVSGMQMFKTDSVLSVLDRLLMILFFSVLLWGNVFDIKIDIFYFAAFQTLSYFITFLIALFVVIRYTRFVKISWRLKEHFALFKRSLPFAILSFLMLFYYRVDSVMLERLLPDGSLHAGIYASAYRILDALGMFSYLFSVLLLPLFSRMLAQKQETGPIVHLASVLLLSAAVVVGVVSFFYSDPIISRLYVDHQAESAIVLRILMQGFMPISAIYIFGTLLTAHGSLKILNMVAGAGVLLNVLLNFYLIPQFFENGAAFSGVATQSMVALSHVVLVIVLVKPAGIRNTIFQLIFFGVFIWIFAVLLQNSRLDFMMQIVAILGTWILFLTISALLWFRSRKINFSNLFLWRKN
jgi:O-antigen/teichoic acid export membrane protein